jgi:hypothetical protein
MRIGWIMSRAEYLAVNVFLPECRTYGAPTAGRGRRDQHPSMVDLSFSPEAMFFFQYPCVSWVT